MAERDIEALAEAAEIEPRPRVFLEWAGPDRLLLVLVFTDIVGSTALNEAIKDERMNEVRRVHFAQSRKLIVDCAGCEIKTIGDAFLVAFRSTDKALDYAIALCKESGAPDLRVRVGIHIGSVSPDERDVYGRAVNFAARVVGAIKDAEIWLSDEALSDLEGFGAIRFKELHWKPHANIRLKGFRGAFRLWSLAPSSSHTSYIRSDGAVPVRADRGGRTKRPGVIKSSRAEFHAAAQNYDRVDFVSSAEVVIDRHQHDGVRGVYAQIDFIERLYVESARARIEFGVRRAYVLVGNDGPGGLARTDHLRAAATRRNVRFVSLHDEPEAVSLCIDPDPGRTSLADLALPPTPRENYLCQIATATAEVEAEKLQAELRVSLDVEGLYLSDDITPLVSLSKKKQIEAIVMVAAKKPDHRVEHGEIRRPLKVQERSR
jgi:class 3 adenylate cyclase